MARVSRGVTAHARHNKVIKAAKGYYGRRKTPSKPQNRLLIRPANMPIATGVSASANSAPYGFSGSMLLPVCMA